MKKWVEVAMKKLPEMEKEILAAENAMQLWTEITFYFDEACNPPINESFIKRVYEYADWCLEQQEGDKAEEHLPTCVVTCFWEHIPTCKAARNNMPRWFSFEDLIANRDFFQYLITEDEFEEIKALYSSRREGLICG